MQLSKIPVANRLQAIEIAIDSLSQKHPEIPELAKTLHYIRSVQRTMVGPRYVTEHSLRHFNESPARLKKKSNWNRVRRQRAIEQNGRLSH